MRKGDMRRGQILDAAERLFYERGYDRTSVQDILDDLNLSKGGFYHYFDAKEAVLRAVCERRAERRFEKLSAELYAPRRGPIERLNLLLGQANLFEAEESGFAAMMLKLCYQDEDAALRASWRQALTDRLLSPLNAAVEDGLRQGCLHARHPMQAGKLLWMLALDVNDEACAMLAEDCETPDVMLRVLELLNAWRDACEQLAGAPYGSIVLFDIGKLLAAWREALARLNGLEGRY